MTVRLLDYLRAALPADFVTTAIGETGENAARIEQMLAGAVPLFAAALPGASPAGIAVMLADVPQNDDLLRQLFGTDLDAMAHSLAGSARSTRRAALSLLNLLAPYLVTGARAALQNDGTSLLALAIAGRGVALAALPPQLTAIIASFPSLARRLTPPKTLKRPKKDGETANWLLALVRKMNASRQRDQPLPK